MNEKDVVKLIILGASGVGKSSIMHYYKTNESMIERKPSFGMEFLTKSTAIKNNTQV